MSIKLKKAKSEVEFSFFYLNEIFLAVDNGGKNLFNKSLDMKRVTSNTV